MELPDSMPTNCARPDAALVSRVRPTVPVEDRDSAAAPAQTSAKKVTVQRPPEQRPGKSRAQAAATPATPEERLSLMVRPQRLDSAVDNFAERYLALEAQIDPAVLAYSTVPCALSLAAPNSF